MKKNLAQKEPQGTSVLCCGTHNKENGIAVRQHLSDQQKYPRLQDERAYISKI